MATRVTAVVLAIGLIGVVALATPAADKGEAELRAHVTKVVRAWETMDLTKIEPYYAGDANLAFYDIAPLKYASWAEYRTGVQKLFFDPNRSLKFTVNDDLRVHRSGRLAWAVFTFGADVVNKQDARSHLDGRWTMILEQRKPGWVVVHEHVSVPLGAS
jgi:ketosteroid isomerase-like protein